MYLGLRSVIYPAPNLADQRAFFITMLGKDPYFDEPFYAGFNVGGFELGLWPTGDPAVGPVAYWGVVDIEAELARLIELGAVPQGDISDVGKGIRMIDVITPAGDRVGLIENPTFTADAPPTTYQGPGR